MVKIAQIKVQSRKYHESSETLFAVGSIMDMNERQIALSVLESLRGDLIYAHLNNGSRILDVADLRQYIYEQMGRIRTTSFAMDGAYGNNNGNAQDVCKSNSHNGEAHPDKIWHERDADSGHLRDES